MGTHTHSGRARTHSGRAHTLTHLLCSLVGEQCKFNRQAFQCVFQGPPRAAVQSGPGGERCRVRP